MHVKARANVAAGHVVYNAKPITDAPDADLLLAAQRDPAQFIALYDRYFARVYGYVRLRVNNQAICEDVTSQVFTTALTRIHTLRLDGNVGAWLLTVAQNAVRDLYRKHGGDANGGELLWTVADSEPSPEEQVLAAERAMELRALLATLRPDQQDLLALRFGAGLRFSEIAQIVGKNPVAVRVTMHRILVDLRRRYPNEG